jgi:hypothetical protein
MRLYLVCLYCFLALPALAQEEIEDFINDTLPVVNKSEPRPIRFLELGVSANSYRGDLATYEKWTACYHGAIRFNEAKRLNGRVGFGYGFITGDNRFYNFPNGKPNNFFRAPVFFLSYEAHYNIIKTRSFMLYASAGLGIYNYLPKNQAGERLVDLLDTRDLDEIYGRVSFMLPIGVGVNYILKNGYGIGAQAQWLNTQTDYLDNIGTWGKKQGNDNVASVRFYIYAPLLFKLPTLITPKNKPKRYYTHEL